MNPVQNKILRLENKIRTLEASISFFGPQIEDAETKLEEATRDGDMFARDRWNYYRLGFMMDELLLEIERLSLRVDLHRAKASEHHLAFN